MVSQKFPTLTKNPIVEAVIELKFNTHSQIPFIIQEIPKLQSLLGFSGKEELKHFSIAQEHGSDADPSVTKETRGYRFFNSDKTAFLVVTSDSMTLSCIGNYSNWDSFLSLYKSYWEKSQPTLRQLNIFRAGVRFINRVVVPIGLDQVGEYLRLASYNDPQTSGIRPDEYFFRIGTYVPAIDGRATITQALDTRTSTDHGTPIILDIDVFVSVDMKPDSKEIWSRLNEMRIQKNVIFFGSLTDKGIDIYR